MRRGSRKEFDLGDMVDVRSDKQVDFGTVRAFQRAENSDVERLGNVR